MLPEDVYWCDLEEIRLSHKLFEGKHLGDFQGEQNLEESWGEDREREMLMSQRMYPDMFKSMSMVLAIPASAGPSLMFSFSDYPTVEE